MLRKLYNIFLVLALLPLASFGQGEYYNNLMAKANDLYSQSLYDSAITVYSEIEGSGLESFNLYYNKGNCAFKLNDLPSAILYYEKASKLKPNDKDLIHNLSLANAQIVDKIEPLPPFFISKWIVDSAELLHSNYWAILNLIFFIVFCLSAGFYYKISKPSLKVMGFYSGLIGLLLFFITLYFGVKKYNLETNNSDAIVFEPSLTVKSEPSENSTELFLLHEGTKISILDSTDNWHKISLPDGNIGWIKSETFRII